MADQMTLQFVIDAEDRTKAAMGSVQGGIDKVQGKLKSMQPAFQKMALAGTAAFVAMGVGVWKATQAAANAQETFSKFDVVFEDVGTKAEEVAQNLRNSWGLAESSAKTLLSGTGDLLVGIGLTGDEALELSNKTVQLGIDLASFQNYAGGATGAVEALTKGLLGEREMLKGLGIVILESDLKLRLLENGTDKLTGTALKSARAEATLQLAMEQSKKAMGDYHRTQGSAVNRQRELAERTKELSETIGKIFIPVLGAAIDKIMPVVEKTMKWVEENQELTKVIIIASAALTGLIATIGIMGLVLPGVITGFGLLNGLLVKFVPLVTGAATKMFGLSKAIVAVNIASLPALLVIGGIITALYILIKLVKHQIEGFDEFGKSVEVIANYLGDAFGGAIDFVRNALSGLMRDLSIINNAIVGEFKKLGIDLESITGGIIGDINYIVDSTKRGTVKAFEGVQSVATGSFEGLTSGFGEVAAGVSAMSEGMAAALDSKLGPALDTAKAKTEEMVDAFEKYNDSIKDVAGSTLDALVDITKEIETLEKSLTDLIKEHAKEQMDFRMEYAEAYLEQEEKINDALEKLNEVKLEGEEKVKDAKERLDDVMLSAEEKVAEAKKRLDEATTTEEIQNAQEAYDKAKKLQAEEIQDAQEVYNEVVSLQVKEEADAQKAYNAEKNRLEEYLHFEEKYHTEIAYLRGEAAKSEIQRTVESIDRAGWKALREFTEAKTKIANELAAENEKHATIKQLEEITLALHKNFMDQSANATAGSIDAQIDKYKELASAMSRAVSGEDVKMSLFDIWQSRPDLQAIFPNLGVGLDDWWNKHGQYEYPGIVLGSYQKGTDYVPETGTYQLHRGEAVIPAGAGVGGITINVMGGNYLSRDAATMFGKELANELKRNIKL